MGASLTLSVTATSATSYQWKRNGRALPGATASALTLSNAHPWKDNGWYQVEVTNTIGTTSATISSDVIFVAVSIPQSRVLVWGDDYYGEKAIPAGLTGVLSVAAGYGQSLALKNDGTVVSWGRPDFAGTVPAGLNNVVAIAVGANTSVALKADGTVVTWGYAAPVVHDDHIVAISAQMSTLLGLKADGTVVAWGPTSGLLNHGQNNVPNGLRDVIAISAGYYHALARKMDGSIVGWGENAYGQASAPTNPSTVAEISAGFSLNLGIRTDGSLVTWGINLDVTKTPSLLNGVVQVSAATDQYLALLQDGSVAAWGAVREDTSGLRHVYQVAAGNEHVVALYDGSFDTAPVFARDVSSQTTNLGDSVTFQVAVTPAFPAPSYQWQKNGTAIPGATQNSLTITNATVSEAGSYRVIVVNSLGTNTSSVATLTVRPPSPPVIASQPADVTVQTGSQTVLTVTASGSPSVTYQWFKNGVALSGATSSALTVGPVTPADAGGYQVVVSNLYQGVRYQVASSSASVGVVTAGKVTGAGVELEPHDIRHPTGNFYDQVQLQGAAASVTADVGQATRISFIDLTNDIVQVEFSGAGTLSLVLDSSSGPAAPEYYNQPTVAYMKGHAGIVIAGADETTNVSVFSVGRATAFDPTGGFNFLQLISAENNPANNGSSLFQGHGGTAYDGYADIAFIAIQSRNGKFGGVRTANASYFASRGYTGVYAPGIDFTGPVYVHDIVASGTALPVLMTGAVSDARVTGGNLQQTNGSAVQIGGINQLRFTAGTSSHGVVLPAQTNKGRLERAGIDVTASVVVNP